MQQVSFSAKSPDGSLRPPHPSSAAGIFAGTIAAPPPPRWDSGQCLGDLSEVVDGVKGPRL